MKNLALSKQILMVALLPALFIAAFFSIYHTWNQFNIISDSLNKNGDLILNELSPAAEYAIYSGNTDLINPLINSVIANNPVARIQILDKYQNSIIDIAPDSKPAPDNSIFKAFFDDRELIFSQAILAEKIKLDDNSNNSENEKKHIKDAPIGKITVTLTTEYATAKKIKQLKHAILITLIILLVTTLVTIRISNIITRPIKSLTRTVRNITAGDLNTPVNMVSTGELGILESCIHQMKNELIASQSDLETQLDIYTDELQQTLEELEIRNAELDITRSKAIYANNAKSEFLANMSHEIRTPLSGVIGFTELLQNTRLSTQQSDYVHTIKKSAKSLLEIINDILDLSKIESGKTEITTSQFNLIDIVEDIITLLSPTALDKDIELFYRIDVSVPTSISADPFRLHQILTNLIGNAIKFTESGYVYLQVTTGDMKNVEHSLKFTISDTGIGMNTNDKKKLFKAFTQADTSITRRFGGTGLGLVISRKLTLLMKGEIGFDSTEGEGSTFWFNIPIIPIISSYKDPELKNRKIALFNNNFIARQAFRSLFDSCNCDVTDYTIAQLNDVKTIENNYDLIVVFLGRKDIIDDAIISQLDTFETDTPSLLIASTQSHSELRNLQQNKFEAAVFTSEKIERIRVKLINLLNKNTLEPEDAEADQIISNSYDWSHINILVVDDNEVNLRLAEIILQNHKARVTTARSGMQAIDYASMKPFDIIFMDLHMPGLDGYETTKRIRESSPGKQPVIIALTANAMPHEKERVIEEGMNGILIKPVSNAIVQKVVNQWVLKQPASFIDEKPASAYEDSKNTVFSLEAAKEFTGDNKELAYELFNMLRSDLKNYETAINQAAADNDMEELLRQAHKLHGASRCCGTIELKNVSSHIEKLINNKAGFDVQKEVEILLNAINNVANFKFDEDNA